MYWGIDLGGTKIEGVVLESVSRIEPLCRLRIDTEAQQGYQHIVKRVSTLVELMAAEIGHRPDVIGIGHPGSTDPSTGLRKNSNTVCLNHQPLHEDLGKTLGCRVNMANDANCFALAEASFGAGRGANTVFGVIMGTGVGGGIVVDNRSLTGCQGIAGEWGHNILLEDGPLCYCGKKGCVETIISGPSLESFYSSRCGSSRQLAAIWEAHTHGSDPHATATIERLLAYFGRAIAVVINILDPDVIVLGGGVSNIPLLYEQGGGRAAKYVFNNSCLTRIVKHELGDSAGVFGAAMLTAA